MVMRFYQRKWRKQEAVLTELLRPFDSWIETASPQENVQAKACLLRVLDQVRNIRPDRRSYAAGNSHFDYLFQLSIVAQELRRKEYVHACHEMVDLIHFNPVSQPRIRTNLICLLSDYLEG